MKNLFTLLALLVFNVALFAQQDIILGGDMEEDTGDWLVSTLNSGADNTSDYEFGYYDDGPIYGEEGALHFSITNTGTDGAHLMFYQEVTLIPGDRYIVDFAAKAIEEMNNSWFEVYLGTAPVDGEDYGSGQTFLGGFKWSGWEEACTGQDLFDGTLRGDGCLAGSTDTIIVEGDAEQTLYIGFKAGIWATATTVEFVVDNFTLINIDAPVSKIEKEMVTTNVYPNPTNSFLNIDSETEIESAKIFNLVGKQVADIKNSVSAIDVSDLATGVYILETVDANQVVSVQKFQKK